MERSVSDDLDESKEKCLTDPPFYLPEFEESYRYIIDDYDVPPGTLQYLSLCCTKTYSSSPSHRIMRKIIDEVLSPGAVSYRNF